MVSYDVGTDETIAELKRRVDKLSRINSSLMQRVERSMDQQANAFSLFQTAIGLESQVRGRTEALKSALDRLEVVNEELVAARDAAERANRFKTRFFTAVGHDLLQPLHAARLSLSAMGGAPAGLNGNRLVEQIDHALSTIEELLRSLLDLSKLEAGVTRPNVQEVAVREIFQSLAVDLQPIARSRDLMLVVRDTELIVRSDPLMLRRILQNLLANAVNYTERGEVLLAARRRASDVHIEVWDTGPGIAPADQARIFEEFQRGSDANRARNGGFGLGLSIVKRMAESLGARVTLCSRVGKGTRFAVALPFAGLGGVSTLSAAPTPVHEAYGFAGSRVVVVDNDSEVLSAMQTLLGMWTCDVRCGESLADLDRLCAEEPEFQPEIVLADYHLDRGETGLDVIARLRKSCGEDLPAIVITADHTPETHEVIRQANCELLQKPVRPAELRALMLHVLSEGRAEVLSPSA